MKQASTDRGGSSYCFLSWDKYCNSSFLDVGLNGNSRDWDPDCFGVSARGDNCGCVDDLRYRGRTGDDCLGLAPVGALDDCFCAGENSYEVG